MSKVYLLKDFSKLKVATGDLLGNFYSPGSDVLVKIHFGEPGNKTALFPKDVEPIINSLKDSDLRPTFIDTLVAYSSPRGTVKGYEQVVKERGYDNLAPFVISDSYTEVETKDFVAQVCKELVEAKNILVLSHVKGHACSGFGGAIKNLGMGGVMAETKSVEHSLCKPKLVSACTGCGICVDRCPAGAIRLTNGKAEFNLDTCWGCSICQLSCPHGCIAPEKSSFDDLLAQGAAAVINNLPQTAYYVNIIKNVTKFCDCEVDSGAVIAQDVGVLFSDNPVAIDKASVELVRKTEGRRVFEVENHKDPLLHVNFASEYTGKGLDYEIVPVRLPTT